MREAVIAEVSTQLSEVVGVIERHLEPTLLAVHLYGSAVDGGLKPHSDIDLLVTVTVRLDETTRRALINDLLETSASPGESEILRAVEVTIVVHDDIIRNVVLTLSRNWYSAVTGKIAPKDVAADWAMERLPAQYQPVILEARQAYLGQEEDRLASRADQLEEFVHYVKGEITKVVGK